MTKLVNLAKDMLIGIKSNIKLIINANTAHDYKIIKYLYFSEESFVSYRL